MSRNPDFDNTDGSYRVGSKENLVDAVNISVGQKTAAKEDLGKSLLSKCIEKLRSLNLIHPSRLLKTNISSLIVEPLFKKS